MLHPIEAVLQYFSLEKRRSLVKRIPSLREVNKNVRYLFDTVKLRTYGCTRWVELDSRQWMFTRDVCYNSNYEHFDSIFYEIYRDMYALLEYYLRRGNTRVKKLVVGSFLIYPNTTSISRIDCLEVSWVEHTRSENVLSAFRNTSIGFMNVAVLTHLAPWVREIPNLQCKNLKLYCSDNRVSSLIKIEELPFEKLEIEEYSATSTQFVKMCQKFKNEKMEIGSKYSCNFQDIEDEFWKTVKQSLPAVVSGENSIIVKTVNRKTKLFVKRTREPHHFSYCVTVMKNETGAVLTYPSLKALLQYLDVKKRRTLAQRIPSIRRVNQKVPFCFDTVNLANSSQVVTIQLDTLIWKFTSDGGVRGVIEHPIGPTSRISNLAHGVYALIRFYLHRNNNRVKKFVNIHLPIPPEIVSFSRIDSLKVCWTSNLNIEKDINEFRDTSIGTMEIDVKTETKPWIQAISNLQCNHLKINTLSQTPDDIFNDLPFKNLEIVESFTTIEKFNKICQKFKDGDMEIGSKYSGKFHENWNDFWRNVKEKLPVEMEGNNFFTTKTSDPKCEMLVERTRGVDFNCKVKIVKANSMNRRKRIDTVRKWIEYQKSVFQRISMTNPPFVDVLFLFPFVNTFSILHNQCVHLANHTAYVKILVFLMQTLLMIGFPLLTLWIYPKYERLYSNRRLPEWAERTFLVAGWILFFLVAFAVAFIVQLTIPYSHGVSTVEYLSPAEEELIYERLRPYFNPKVYSQKIFDDLSLVDLYSGIPSTNRRLTTEGREKIVKMVRDFYERFPAATL